ncbi:hypothetical protein N0V83_006708 [Neocucurbitaria cava]|uniref:Uncharacterized protein n=1 Tax=Neocucurbitaria cava TaxID=798079 RepID=A0A9W8Y6N4_9PLEO|nr:hypothetical protein N0V83_006708 [Neocucurbitaria cava]
MSDPWLEPFSNLGNPLLKRRITSYARTALDRLPRELRDEVYKHLWESYNFTPSSAFRRKDMLGKGEDSIHNTLSYLYIQFLSPSYVGRQFVQEALQWFLQHGCAGRYVTAAYLGIFLTNHYPGINITPANSNMRSLNIGIDVGDFDRVDFLLRQRLYSIKAQFAPLLALDLIKGFKLLIRVSIPVWKNHCPDARRLPTICAQLKNVMQSFEKKGSKVVIEFEFAPAAAKWHPEPLRNGFDYHPFTVNTAPRSFYSTSRVRYFNPPWNNARLVWTPNLSRVPPIRGKAAVDLLDATGIGWADYMRNELNVCRCVILEESVFRFRSNNA